MTYKASVFNYREREGMEFAVGADLDSAVLAAIDAIGSLFEPPGGRRR